MKTILILILCLSFARAQEIYDQFRNLTLEELFNVTIASKKSENVLEAPGIVSVITRDEIEGFASNNLGEVLSKIAGGIFLTASVFTDNLISLRGQSTTPYNNHILVLIDGRAFRDPITGGINNVLFMSFPLSLIDRIEVIRGPGSVLYGSNAFSGIFNIVTKQNSIKPKYIFEAFYDSFSGIEGSAVVLSKNSELNFNIAIKYHNDKGEKFSFTDFVNVYNSENFDKEYFNAYLKVEYKNFKIASTYLSYSPYALIGGVYNWDFEDPYDNNNHKHLFVDAEYLISINEELTLVTNVTFNKRIWVTHPDLKLYGYSILPEVVIKYNFSTKGTILLGSTYEYNNYSGEKLIDNSNNNYSIYSQIDYKLFKYTKLILGLQLNKIENISWDFSPRIGLIQFFTKKIGVKFLYSEAFRKAYPLETSFDVPVFKGNLELNPERINTTELQLFYHTENVKLDLTGYYSKMNDIIFRERFVDANVLPYGWYQKYINKGSHKFWGTEIEFDLLISKYLKLFNSFVYQNNENDNAQENATLHPKYYLKNGILISYKKIQIGIFNSGFYELNKVENINPSARVVNKQPESFNLLSVKFSAVLNNMFNLDFKKDVKFTFSITNLLNKDIRYPEFTTRGINSLIPLTSGRYIKAGFNISL